MFIVNNNIWRIKDVSPNDPNLMRNNGTFSLGVCDNNQKCIFINRNVDNYRYKHILTHELVHVFAFEYGLKIPIDLEEEVCNFVASYGRNIIEIADMLLHEIKLAEA